LLTGLKTCLFNHGPHNLLLQPQPLLSPGESVAYRPDNLVLKLHSHARRTTTRLNKEQTMATSHTQPRGCMATTSNNYDTHDIGKYGMLGLHRRCGSFCSSPWIHRVTQVGFSPFP
jgi:hypothetical protein